MDHPRILRRILLALIVVGLLVHSYRYRCLLLTCQPATWPEIQQLAQQYAAHAGPGYRMGLITTDAGPLTPDGPATLRIRIQFIGTEHEPDQPDRYPVRTIEFDDRERHIRWIRWTLATGTRLTPESQDHHARVRIGPREAYRIALTAARVDVPSATTLDPGSATLFVKNDPHGWTHPDSFWSVSYLDDHTSRSYSIDAQSGAIIDRHHDEGRGPSVN